MTKPKVFCIGWAKTGTTRLGAAFRMLGCAHTTLDVHLYPALARGDLGPLFDHADRFEAFDDWPWNLRFRDLARRYPDARFVRTLRDATAIVKGWRSKVAQQFSRPPRSLDVWQHSYGFDPERALDAAFVARVEAHNADVQAFFADQPGRLLTMRITQGEGWDRLCPFLGQPAPSDPFPRANVGRAPHPVLTPLRKLLVASKWTVKRLAQR